MRASPNKPSRLRRYARRSLQGVAALLGLVVFLVSGTLFSLRFAGVRSYVVSRVNGALADAFKGRLVLHGVQRLGLTGIAAADAEVFDPAGRRVLDIHGLDAELSVPRLVWAALRNRAEPLTIRITSVSLRHAEVVLIDNGTGSPSLADVFVEKTPSPASSGPGTIIILSNVRLHHLWAHGALAGVPPLDVELKDAVAALRVDARETSLVLERVGLEARGLPEAVDPKGQAHGSLQIPSALDQSLRARVHYEGTAAETPVILDASFIESRLVATLRANDIPPAVIARQIPGLTPRTAPTLTASLEGKLPELHGHFALGIGSGAVEGDCDLSLRETTGIKATLHARDLDLADLTPSAPTSSLDLDLHAALVVPQAGPLSGNFELTSQPSLVLAETMPKTAVSGSFSNDSKLERLRVDLHAEIAEPGAQTGLDATLTRTKKTTLEFRSATRLLDPPRLRRLSSVTSLRGDLSTQGSYRLEDQFLDARVRADLGRVQQRNNTVESARLSAALNGRLPHPSVDLHVDVQDATIEGQHVTEAHLTTRGALSRWALSAELATSAPERKLELSSSFSNERGIRLSQPSLNLHQGKSNLRVRADSVEFVAGRTRLSGMRLEGAGTADVSLEYGSALESVHVQTYDLEVARLWSLVDAHAPLTSGTATVSASYDRGVENPRLRLVAQARGLSFARVSGGSMSADLAFEKRALTGRADADLRQLGHLSFDAQDLRGVELSKFDPAKITGKLSVEGQVRLKDLLDLVPRDVELPIGRALGVVTYDAIVEREHASPGLPAFHVHVSTKKLQLAGRRDSKTPITTKAEARAAAPLATKGLDVDVDLTHAEAGETALAASVNDELGRLVAVSIEGKVSPRADRVVSELSDHWREIPLSVNVSVPRRELDKLPVELRPAAVSGVLSCNLSSEGTLSEPSLKLSGSVEKLRRTDGTAPGLDLTWLASYSGTLGKFEGSARDDGREVVGANVDFRTAIAAWLKDAGTSAPPLEANARVRLDGFPIGLLPAATTGQLDGALSGALSLEHFGSNAALEANLEMPSLKLGNSNLGRIRSEIRARNGAADLSLRVDGAQGTTTAEAHSSLDWGARYVPLVRVPAQATLRARELRLAAFGPFLTSTFGEIDGLLNGDLDAHFRGGPPELKGHAELREGVAQVASVGQRFDQIAARVSLGDGKAKLEQLSARATSGILRATGEARFAGLDLTGADAHLRIGKSEKVSLSVAGREVGETWGAIDVKLRPTETPGSLALSVDIPELHVRMPDTGSQDLQDLEPAKGVRVGTWEREGRFVTLPLQPLRDGDPGKNESPTIVELHLGDQVFLQQGDTTKIQLAGAAKITLGDPMTMVGQIEVKGGKLDVSGKEFELESGKVTFSGEPANPTIVATARWDAQDDEHHRVYADASGTASNLKVNLRSEPPLTQDQVLSLIVTGSADGSLGGSSNSSSGSSNTAATAVGAVGGAATQGINKALSGISNLDVSTRVDTSTGSARPELVLQISPRVAAQITRALGEPAPGQPPDLTFLTLNFRLFRNWSLSALIGDRGESGLDLVWRKRY